MAEENNKRKFVQKNALNKRRKTRASDSDSDSDYVDSATPTTPSELTNASDSDNVESVDLTEIVNVASCESNCETPDESSEIDAVGPNSELITILKKLSGMTTRPASDKFAPDDIVSYNRVVKLCETGLNLQTLAKTISVYREKINNIMLQLEPPQMRTIIDLDIPDSIKAELIQDRLQMECQTAFSANYRAALDKLNRQIKYYSDETTQRESLLTECARKRIEDSGDRRPLSSQILLSDQPNNIKKILYDFNIAYGSGCNDTSEKYKSYIRYALRLPTKAKIPACDNTIANLYNRLNERIFGMQHVKEKILSITMQLFGDSNKNKIFGMVGPPGVGKTMIARAIADVIGLPMQQFSLGGATDSAYLEGHGFTYEGSMPGMIAKSMMSAGCTNAIIHIDEAEKTSKTSHGRELEHSLLHVIDFTQNHDFRDKYMPEIPIDLSNCTFILSMNSLSGMDPALVSRIPIIHVDGYTPDEKIAIVSDFIIPKILANFSAPIDTYSIKGSAIRHLIRVTHEEGESRGKSGVRALELNCNKIIEHLELYRKTNGIKFSSNIKNFSVPFTITSDIIDKIVETKSKDTTYRDSMYR